MSPRERLKIKGHMDCLKYVPLPPTRWKFPTGTVKERERQRKRGTFFSFFFFNKQKKEMALLFGAPLITALARSSFTTPSGLSIPGILARIFDELQAKGFLEKKKIPID